MATQPDEETIGDDSETGPLRRCLVTGQRGAREKMLRFVVGPEHGLVFDADATLPGRGLWLSASRDVIELSFKRGVFSRAAKQQVLPPPDLALRVETALRKRVSELLGLARRAGNAVAGYERAREWLVSAKAGLVVQAMDGSPEERARFTGGREIPVVMPLTAAALGRIFGREQAVHAVIAAGPLARKIQIEAERLAGVAVAKVSGQ